jgi:hypothetical protein
MAARTLQNSEIALGRAVLLATDALNMGCEGAFWMMDDGDDDWRFFLVTSLLDTMGPRRIYLKMDSVLGKIISEGEMDALPVYMMSPDEKIVRAIRMEISTAGTATIPQGVSFRFDGQNVAALVYRMAGKMPEAERRAAQGQFRKRVDKLVAA